jgi:hypothetical protein
MGVMMTKTQTILRTAYPLGYNWLSRVSSSNLQLALSCTSQVWFWLQVTGHRAAPQSTSHPMTRIESLGSRV